MRELLIAGLCLMLCAAPAGAHDWYSGKQSYKGYSCCNGNAETGDCKPVQAWTTDDGRWQFRYVDGKVYDVPPEAIHPDEENQEPFQASACVYHGEVLCFWRKAAGG